MVLRGECLRLDGGELPYAPLAALLRDAPPERLDAALGELGAEVRAELERSFPHLGAGLPVGGGSQPDRFAQARVYEAIVLLLGALGRRGAGAARARGRALGRPLDARLRALPGARAAPRAARPSAITYRTGELGSDHPVREMLADLQYHDRVDAGRARAARPRRRRRPARGHPRPRRPSRRWSTRSTSAAAATRCSRRSCCRRDRDPGGEKLPARLADALRVRLRRVPEPVRRLLPYAAAIGRPASAALLGAASGDRASPSSRPRCATRSTTTCSSTTASATRSPSATTSCARRSTPTCCPGERAPLHARGRDGDRRRRRAGRAGRALARRRRRRRGAAGVGRRRAGGRGGARVRRGAAPPPRGARAVAGERRDVRARPRSSCSATLSDLARTPASTRRRSRGASRRSQRSTGPATPARAARFFERLGRLQAFAGRRRPRRLQRGAAAAAGRTTASGGRGCWAPRRYALWTVQRHERGARAREEALDGGRGGGRAPARRPTPGRCSASSIAYAGRPAARRGAPAHARSPSSRASGAPRTCSTPTSTWPSRCGCSGDFEGALEVTERRRARTPGGSGWRPRSGASWRSTRPPTSSCSGRWEARARRGWRSSTAPTWSRGTRSRAAQVAGPAAARARAARGGRRASCEAPEALCDGAPAEYVPAVYAGLAELELWQRPAPARRATLVEQGLEAMRGGEELLYAPALYAMGVRVEAEAALAAAASRPSASAPSRPPPGCSPSSTRSWPARRRRRRRSPTATRRAPRPRGPPARTARTLARGAPTPGRRSARRTRRPTPAGAGPRRCCATPGAPRGRRRAARRARAGGRARRRADARGARGARAARARAARRGRPRTAARATRRRWPRSGSPRASSRCSSWSARG